MIYTIATDHLTLTKNGKRSGLLVETAVSIGEGYFLRVEPFDIDALRALNAVSKDTSRKLTSANGLLILPCMGESDWQTQAASRLKVNLIKRILENCG